MITIIYQGTGSDDLLQDKNRDEISTQVLEEIKRAVKEDKFIVYAPEVSKSHLLPKDKSLFTMYITIMQRSENQPHSISDNNNK